MRSYQDYLRSAHWADVKARYRASDRPQHCQLCGTTDDIALHHLTYDRLGCELLTDLAPLCRRCHTLVHVLERRGDIGLDLRGLYDSERAGAYRAAQQEARERAIVENATPRQPLPVDTDGYKPALHARHLRMRERTRNGGQKLAKARRQARNEQEDRAASRTPEAREHARQRNRDVRAANEAAISGPRTFLP